VFDFPKSSGPRGPAETAPPREGRTCDDLPVGQPTTDVTGRAKFTANLGSPVAAGVALRCPRVVRGWLKCGRVGEWPK
jgi:hypothetical protein